MSTQLFASQCLPSHLALLPFRLLAIWNMITMYHMMADVVILTFGPALIMSMTQAFIAPRKDSLSEESRLQLLRAVGVMISTAVNLHPNNFLLMQTLKDMLLSDDDIRKLSYTYGDRRATSPPEKKLLLEALGDGLSETASAAVPHETRPPPVGGATLDPGAWRERGARRSIRAGLQSPQQDVEMVTGGAPASTVEDNEPSRWNVHESMEPLRLDRPEILHYSLASQSTEDQVLTLRIMTLAAVIDGGFTRAKRAEIDAAAAVTKDEFDHPIEPRFGMIELIAEHFRRGMGLYPEDLATCVSVGGSSGNDRDVPLGEVGELSACDGCCRCCACCLRGAAWTV